MNTVINLYSASVPTRLLASTALVLSAGVAAAEVKVSGDGRMGLVYDGDDVRFTSRVRVIFTLSGETDMGLAFGGTIRADNAANGARGQAGNIFVSGDWGKLSMGDVDGAALKAVGDLHFTSLTGLGDLNEMIYLSRAVDLDQNNPINVALGGLLGGLGNLPRALYEYKIDGFAFYASVDNPNVIRDVNGDKVTTLRNIAVGASYTFEGFTGGIGYEDLRVDFGPGFIPNPNSRLTANHVIASAAYSFDGFEVKAIAGRIGGDLGDTLRATNGLSRNQWGISATGTFDDVTVSAFYNDNPVTEAFGVGASYNLGGGAELTGGVVYTGRNQDLGLSSRTLADFGLKFRF